MKKTWISLGIILSVLGIGLGGFWVIQAKASNVSVDSPEAEAYKKVLVQFYKALFDAQKHGVVSGFDQVFVDRPGETSIDTKTKEMVRSVYGSDAATNAGLLSVYKAKYTSIWNAKQKLQELTAKSKSENRKLTAAEGKEIADASNGMGIPGFSSAETFIEPHIIIESIQVTGDHAIVRFKVRPDEVDAYMIQINDQWYIYKFNHIHSDL